MGFIDRVRNAIRVRVSEVGIADIQAAVARLGEGPFTFDDLRRVGVSPAQFGRLIAAVKDAEREAWEREITATETAGAVWERVLEEHLAHALGLRFATRPDGMAREIIGAGDVLGHDQSEQGVAGGSAETSSAGSVGVEVAAARRELRRYHESIRDGVPRDATDDEYCADTVEPARGVLDRDSADYPEHLEANQRVIDLMDQARRGQHGDNQHVNPAEVFGGSAQGMSRGEAESILERDQAYLSHVDSCDLGAEGGCVACRDREHDAPELTSLAEASRVLADERSPARQEPGDYLPNADHDHYVVDAGHTFVATNVTVVEEPFEEWSVQRGADDTDTEAAAGQEVLEWEKPVFIAEGDDPGAPDSFRQLDNEQVVGGPHRLEDTGLTARQRARVEVLDAFLAARHEEMMSRFTRPATVNTLFNSDCAEEIARAEGERVAAIDALLELDYDEQDDLDEFDDPEAVWGSSLDDSVHAAGTAFGFASAASSRQQPRDEDDRGSVADSLAGARGSMGQFRAERAVEHSAEGEHTRSTQGHLGHDDTAVGRAGDQHESSDERETGR